MTTPAWIFMLSVWSLVIAAVGFSFFKLLTSKRQFDDHDEPQ